MNKSTKAKYISRLQELITVGEQLPQKSKQVPSGGNMLSGETYYKTRHYIQGDLFTQWKTNSISLLDTIIPASSIHRSSVERFHNLSNEVASKEFGVSFLKAILDDFEKGFLDDLERQVDAELNADYLTQAESLLQFGTADKSHIPAAVLAGAVLEHGLRGLCQQLDPPEPLEAKGKRLMMGALIDALKKRGVFNELTAKQLRGFTDIRNAAAHGNFSDFSSELVTSMVSGIGSFLAMHSS